MRRYSPASNPISPPSDEHPWQNPDFLTPKTGFPLYFRPTFGLLPQSISLLRSLGCPFGFVVSPGMVSDLPLFDHTDTEFPRCLKCFAYVSPYVERTPDNRKYKCAICGQMNVLRGDSLQSVPELGSPFYDVLPPENYRLRPQMCASFCFVIDISETAVGKGFCQIFAASIRSILPSLGDQIRVSIVTVGQKVVWYNLLNGTAVVPADLSDIAVPLAVPVQLGQCRECCNRVLDSIIGLKRGEAPADRIVGALNVVGHVLGVTGGIVAIGMVDCPTRQSEGWHQLGSQLSGRGISCYCFTATSTPTPTDCPCLSSTCSLTGGRLYEYGDFPADARAKLHADLFQTLSADYLWDCTTRLRCSGGVRFIRFAGNFLARGDLVTFPVMRGDCTFIAEVDLPQPIMTPQVIVQLGMLFTTSAGERRARVLTFSIPVASSPQAIIAAADPVALAVVLSRRIIGPQLGQAPSLETCLSMFAVSGGTQFRVLFRLIHAFLSSSLARPGQMDNARRALANWFTDCAVEELLLWFYPRLFAVDRGIGPLPCVTESFQQGRVFLLHAHNAVYIWIGEGADPVWVERAVGNGNLEECETPEKTALFEMVQECQHLSRNYLPLIVVRQGDPNEAAIGGLLLDQPGRGPPFADWYSRIVAVPGGLPT
jgi:hypothetical protein